jgi:FtsP/CotA-like multicopper oxidase with cupredoxin domain
VLGAAFIHLAVAPEHLSEYVPFGVFFLAVGSAQIVASVEFANRPSRVLAALLTLGNAGLVGLWYVSRTSGLPVGPTPGQPEEIGLPDVVCNAMEVLSVLLTLSLIAWPARRNRRRVWLVAAGALPSAILSVALTSASVLATITPMPEAANAAPPVVGQSTASITSLVAPPGNEPVEHFTLVAAPTQIDGREAWALNGTVPGPELRVHQGDRVQVTLINQLPESTTLHWHGVELPNAEDGVAGVTQDAVPPGGDYTYEFVAREAGTYWYHSHQQTESQLPKGLFGPLVVLPSEEQPQTRDYTLMLHGSAGHVAIDGATDSVQLEAQPGDTVRLRLINAVDPGMDGGPEAPVLFGAPAQVVALDGRDLNEPQSLGPTRIPLGMGQRADLVFSMPPSGAVTLVDTELSGGASPFQRFFSSGDAPSLPSVTIGDGDAPAPEDASAAPLFDALDYGAPAFDGVASANPDLTVPIVLGEHPGIRDGRPQLVHTINDAAAPDVAPISVTEGQIVHLHIVNTTGECHPMHLHGHVLSVLAIDGQPVVGSPVHLDSVLVGPNQTIDAAFAANNPGVWMFHCHVLLHAGMGMTTSVNYVGYSSPFEMGTRSGNMPE